MKNVAYTYLTICLFIGITSCKKALKDETEDPVIPGVEQPIPATTRVVKVSFPAGMSVNLEDYTLSSLSLDNKLDGTGNVEAAYNSDLPNIAWLFDKENNVVMAGFMTDSTTAVNAASTAKVLLYYSYALPYRPAEVTNRFIKDIHTLPGVADWNNKFAALLKADRLVLNKGGYASALKQAMSVITKDDVVDLKANARTSDIRVEDSDAKSGLQLSEDGLSKLSIANNYRRRAHAFFYKTKFKDLNGTEKGIISEFNSTTPADRDEMIDPVAAANSFTGVLGNWIEGEGMKLAVAKAGPFDLPLAENESEATYKVRIVGPGIDNSPKLTNAEASKLFRLQIETIAMDFLIPLFASEVIGKIDHKGKADASEAEKAQLKALVEVFTNVTEEVVNSTPGAYEEIKKGNYDGALTKILEGFYSSATSVGKESFAKLLTTVGEMAIQQKYYVNPGYDYLKDVQRKLKILEVIDKALTIGDYARLLYDLNSSRTFEEWTVKLTASKVSLKATKEVVVPYEPSTISAVIKNLDNTGDTHPYFEWKTSGKYGTLSDTKGHTQQTSFGSADADVTYVSRQNVSESTENIEYIYVTAFYQNKEIGKDTITLNVKKDKYTISPDGVTLSGQDGETHSAALYLVKPDGTSGIGSSPDFDYKIVWTTGGTYGKLSGNKTSVTNYNNNRITFTVFDDKTKEATQKVSARVYLKKKSEPESAYILTSEDDVSIKINNDDKKKIVHYSLIAMHFDELSGPFKDSHFREYWYHGCANQGLVPVKEEKDAVSYSLTFKGGIVIGAPSGYNWTPENLSFSGAADMPGSPGKYSGGTYYVFYTGLGSSASPTYTPTLCCHSPSDSKYITGVKAEVVITLK